MNRPVNDAQRHFTRACYNEGSRIPQYQKKHHDAVSIDGQVARIRKVGQSSLPNPNGWNTVTACPWPVSRGTKTENSASLEDEDDLATCPLMYRMF